MIFSPRVDCVYKDLFGSKGREKSTEAFINSLLLPTQQKAEGLTFMNPITIKEESDEKITIYDVMAKDKYGCLYNLEMQNGKGPHYLERAFYYFTRLFYKQLREGEIYGFLRRVITINVLNFDCFEGEDYHHVFCILKRGRGSKDDTSFEKCGEMHFIELKKFLAGDYKLDTEINCWSDFLGRGEEYTQDTLPEELRKDLYMKSVFDALEQLSLDDKKREAYEARLKEIRDKEDEVTGALKKGEEIGKEIGKEIGLKQGEEIGKEIGLKQGEEIGKEIGKEIGLKQGEEIGLKKGGQIALKKSLVRQIHRKFGDVPIPSKVLIVIDGSDEEELLDMTDRVWEVNALEELVAC
jgi:predicted transposase/invertase (TIGR01784 family)